MSEAEVKNMEEKDKLLQTFMRSLTDRELEAGSTYYEPDLHLDSEAGDPVTQLAWQIRSVDGAAIYFFSGMIGAGKSTELMRLQKLLREDGHIAVYVDMARYINLGSPVGLVDLLMGIAGAFSDEVSKPELLGSDPAHRGYWERATAFLDSNVLPKELGFSGEANVLGGKLGINLKTELDKNPTFKAKLQEVMSGMTGAFVDDVRAYIAEVSTKLKSKTVEGKQLILLLDSLERIQGAGTANDPVMASVRKLFRENLDQLYLPPLKIVYSIAPYLCKLEPNVFARIEAANICNLTCIPVYQRNSRAPRNEAVEQLTKLVAKRFPDWQKVLSSEQLKKIMLKSGGDLREFLLLLRTLVTRVATKYDAVLPVRDADVESAIVAVRRNKLPIPDSVRDRLRPIHENGQPKLHDENDVDGFVSDLNVKRVLMYRNGEEWYGVHPLLWEEVEKVPAG
jgi:hypothetical protein